MHNDVVREMSDGGGRILDDIDFIQDKVVRAYAVYLIIKGEAERALDILSRYYGIVVPKIKIGLPKRHSKALGCYDQSRETIYLRSSREYRSPYIVLHEFYHHLRGTKLEYPGSEKHADKYALESIRYFKELASLKNLST